MCGGCLKRRMLERRGFIIGGCEKERIGFIYI